MKMLKRCCGNVLAHLDVTIKHLTRYKQKLDLAAMLENTRVDSTRP